MAVFVTRNAGIVYSRSWICGTMFFSVRGKEKNTGGEIQFGKIQLGKIQFRMIVFLKQQFEQMEFILS